jgi:glucan 1,3-beta-glucosidase
MAHQVLFINNTGSQNGFDNSGHRGSADWNPLLPRTPHIIAMIAERYAKDSDTVSGIQGVNEPFPGILKVSLDSVQTYFKNAYKQVRNSSPANLNSTISFWLHDSFNSLDAWEDVGIEAPDYTQVVMDSHHYEMFDAGTLGLGLDWHINNIRATGVKAASFSSRRMPVVFGEWCGALTDCTKYRKYHLI